MKVVTRWLMDGMHKLDIWEMILPQAFRTLPILSALVFFCLAQSGCDGSGDSPGGIVPSQGNTVQDSRKKEDGRLALRQEESSDRRLPRIVAFGDSLTAGLGVASTESYPGQLAQWLHEQGFEYEVINAGVSGETSAGGLRRVDWILKSHPTLVILELGVNDGLRGKPLQETYENLSAIIERLRSEGVRVVLAGMRLPLNYGDDYTQEFSALYEQLAKEYGVPFIPFFLEGVATHRHLNQGDGIHPTAEGYSIVVQNVWGILQPILKELDLEGSEKIIAPLSRERRATTS
ncbi:MAG: arylesterase [Nitrospirota bacterium]|nr:arylesterase [Nitrospirota bacterium]